MKYKKLKITNWKIAAKAAKAIREQIRPFDAFKVTLKDGQKFSAICAGQDGWRFQTWNSKTNEWDGFNINPAIVAEIEF